MGEFKICVTYFIRLDGKVRDRDALVRKVSGGMRVFRKKESEKEDEKTNQGNGRGRKKKGKERFLFLSAFVFIFFLFKHIYFGQSVGYTLQSLNICLRTIILIVLIGELL